MPDIRARSGLGWANDENGQQKSPKCGILQSFTQIRKVSSMNARSILFALLAAAGASRAIAPVEAYGPLKVVGNKLTDSTGKSVVLRGVSLFESKHPNGLKYYNTSVIKWLQSDWNITLVRAAMGVTTETWSEGGNSGVNKGYIDDPTGNTDRVNKVIDGAIDAGIYVLVDWHVTGQGDGQTSKAVEFFSMMAKKYGNTPNIIWEIWNEPLTDWSNIASHAKQVIPAIRKYSNNPIVVGTPGWSSQPNAAGSDLSSYANILYTLHFYAAEGAHDGYKSNLTSAMNASHAVFASEWGTCNANGNGSINTGNSSTWLSFLETNGVSSANWSITDKAETCAALNPGASTAGGWTPATDLTASGTYIRNYLLGANKYNGARFTGPDTTTRLSAALKADAASVYSNGTDTVTISAHYNKIVPTWTLTLTGQTSGAVFTASGNLSSSVNVNWAATMKKAFTTKVFTAGETVKATLVPGGPNAAAATTNISVIAGVGVNKRYRNLQLGWSKDRISLPFAALPEGQAVTVRLIGLDGATLWSAASQVRNVDGGTAIDLARPALNAVSILEVDAGTTRIRSTLTPRY